MLIHLKGAVRLCRLVFGLTLLSLIPSMALSQNGKGSISGMVTDEQSTPLPYVNLLLLSSMDSAFVRGTISRENGRFLFESVKTGSYIIAASRVGYKRVHSSPFEINSQTAVLDIGTLQFITPLESEGITLTAQRPLIEQQADRTVINVENSIVDAGGNAWDIIQKSPGVTVDNNDQLSISGKQGTIVMLNGKRTFLSAEDLAAYLRGLNSKSIEKIEIITNPSAKYEASGNAGIINIVSKRNENLGFNSTASISAGAGWGNFYSPSLNFNYKQEKLNLYGNYSYGDRNSLLNLGLLRNINTPERRTVVDQSQAVDINSQSHLAGLGFEYALTPNQTAGAYVSGNLRDDLDDGETNTGIFNQDFENSFLGINSGISGDITNYSANLTWKGSWEKAGEFAVNADYLFFDIGDAESYVIGTDFSENTPSTQQTVRNRESSDIGINTVKFDYSRALSKQVSIETGYKLSDVTSDNSIRFDSLINGQWQRVGAWSNAFLYDETVHAGYASTAIALGKWQINLGLRAENTLATGQATSQRRRQSYLDWFPTASATYNFSRFHRIGLSYGRRIDRPGYQNLNPFIFFVDPFTFLRGNSFLTPQYTDNLELSYSRGSLNFSAGYSRTTDRITFVATQENETATGIASYENFETLHNFRFNTSYQKNLTPKWTLFSFVSTFYNRFDARFNGGAINDGRVTSRVNVNNSFKLPHGVSLDATAFYQSPFLNGFNEFDGFYFLNAGVRKKFGGVDVRLAVNDILNSNRQRGGTTFQDIDNACRFRRRESRVTVTLSYFFGNRKVKNRRNRSGASEEKGRVILDQ